jgi:hypothetical protein
MHRYKYIMYKVTDVTNFDICTKLQEVMKMSTLNSSYLLEAEVRYIHLFHITYFKLFGECFH